MNIKKYMLPIAMLAGGAFHTFFGALSFLTPYLIFAMLVLSYSRLTLAHLRVSPRHMQLLAVQCLGGLGVYCAAAPLHAPLAQGLMLCVLAPTATAAVVITRMLGGNVASVTAYSLLSNVCAAVCAPLFLPLAGGGADLPFGASLLHIGRNVMPLILAPLALNLLLRKCAPPLHCAVQRAQPLSFYLWALALAAVTGRMVDNMLGYIARGGSGGGWTAALLALGALAACLGQFMAGRAIGRRRNDTVACGQGLGQKNTILAIWMAEAYLNPLAAIGPGAYVLWQNMVNSYQLWRMTHHRDPRPF